MTTKLQRATELGQGLYSLAELRAFLTYSGSREDGEHAGGWLADVLLPVGRRRWRPDYSFSDLISLFVVRELRRRGLSTRAIREAEEYLRRKWDTDRPFVSGEIKTDGCGIFVDDDLIAGQLEAAELKGQQVMREPIRHRLKAVHYDDGTAAYWTPTDHVLVDPRVQFGEPVIKGTRVPTAAVADMTHYATGAEIAADLGISPDLVTEARRFEQRLAASHN